MATVDHHAQAKLKPLVQDCKCQVLGYSSFVTSFEAYLAQVNLLWLRSSLAPMVLSLTSIPTSSNTTLTLRNQTDWSRYRRSTMQNSVPKSGVARLSSSLITTISRRANTSTSSNSRSKNTTSHQLSLFQPRMTLRSQLIAPIKMCPCTRFKR